MSISNEIRYSWSKVSEIFTETIFQPSFKTIWEIFPELSHGQAWPQGWTDVHRPVVQCNLLNCLPRPKDIHSWLGRVACLLTVQSLINTVAINARAFSLGTIKIHWHFLSFPIIKTVQVVKILPRERRGPIYTSYVKYHGCWWSGQTRDQGSRSHGIDLVYLEYSSFSIQGVHGVTMGGTSSLVQPSPAIMSIHEHWLNTMVAWYSPAQPSCLYMSSDWIPR